MNARRAVYFARHGETAWNQAGRWQGHTDIALNDAGRAQSRVLATRVAGLGITRVFASDLRRAAETGEIVAAALGAGPVGIDAGFRERGFGWFEGLTREECVARYPVEWEEYQTNASVLCPPGGEPMDVVRARMRDATLRAAATFPTGDDDAAAGLAVSHGSAIRLLVGSITGVVPPPIANGALFRVWVSGPDLLVGADRID